MLSSDLTCQGGGRFTDYCSKCGGILSTVGGVQYRGGYHEYRGGLS